MTVDTSVHVRRCMGVGWKSQCISPVCSVYEMLGWAECDCSCGGLFGRRRPFLIRPLENTLIKLLRSLDFYDEVGRTKIAMGAPPLRCCVRACLCCAV